MKKFISIILLMAIVPMVLPSVVSADDNTFFNLLLIKQPKDDSGNEVDPDDDTHRAPSRPIVCTISATGGVQCAIPKSEIVSYELLDVETDACIVAENDEFNFVYTLFTLSEDTYLLKIITTEYQYLGEFCIY